MALTITSLILDSGVIPPGTGAFPWFVAVQNGFTSALCTCLLINGFVGFQLYEDGTSQSVWLLRGSSVAMFAVSFAVSILTFMAKAGLGPTNTLALFVVLYIVNGICLLVYFVMQVILVTGTLQDRWPLGDIFFGVLFFVAGQVVLYVFSDQICAGAQHYLDGTFITTICNLLAVMMVYKVCDLSLATLLKFVKPAPGFSSCPVSFCPSLAISRSLLLETSATVTDCIRSIGTPSPRKILSSASAPSKAIGKSKNSSCQKTTIVRQCIKMRTPSIQAAHITAILCMAAATRHVEG